MMHAKQFALVCLFILLNFLAFSQKSLELGLMIGSVYHYKSHRLDNRLNSKSYTFNYNFDSFYGSILCDINTDSNLFYRIQVGYIDSRSKSDNEFNWQNGDIIYTQYQRISKGLSTGFGVGKRIGFNNIMLKFGIELSAEYLFENTQYEQIDYYYDNGTVDIFIITVDEPREFTGSLNLITGVQYYFLPSVNVGLHIINGIRYTHSKGTLKGITEKYDANGQLIDTINDNDRLIFTSLGTTWFWPSLVISYHF